MNRIPLPPDLIGGALGIYERYAPLFWFGVRNTLLISLSATVIGLFIGLFFASLKQLKIEKKDNSLVKLSKVVLRVIANLYIEIFRGTPMIVQAIFLYHGLRPLIGWTPLTAGIVIVSINTGAYMAEIIRAGIQSIDKGQYEASRSLGMNHILTMVFVILPQAIKNAFPAIGNEFVVNIKDTAVLNVIGVSELYFQSTAVAGIVFRFRDTFLITALIYLFLTFTTTQLLRIAEKKLDTPEGLVGASSSSSKNFFGFKRKGGIS
jgi:putative lysine transport system permease protein